MNSLYETDHHKWLTEQVGLLANKQFDQLDLENLLEELELGIEAKVDNLENYLSTLITHLLKCDYQTTVLRDTIAAERFPKGWVKTIYRSRNNINKLIRKNPCLKPRIENILENSYPEGKKDAIWEMNLHIPAQCPKLDNSSYPDKCPWSYEQMMSEDWYP
ncbi:MULTISPECIES: DUF29 domain-containing protein [unclassified Endozoicomonas]|uniref:DUF29 domain-containing protein n=2 Tax=Endozoicomonas TaxID=305899 RepID=UPI002148ECC8|nr:MULTISPECIES: DUF29 domain-containing protein [unclassified Endozoicomonas]